MKYCGSSFSPSSAPVSTPSSVSLSTRTSTSASSSGPTARAGAGLRMVVAPVARARWKNAEIAGRGISNWLTATSPLASGAAATSAASTSALAPGMTTMVLSALATVMMAVPLWASGVSLHQAEVDRLRREVASATACQSCLRRAARSMSSARLASRPPPPGWRPCRRGSRARPCPRRSRRSSGWRSAVATTSMLMLPATNTRPISAPGSNET